MKAAKRFLSMLVMLCMVVSLLPSTVFAANSSVPFTDVKETDWFYDAVGYVYENGMMSGTGSNQFSPNMTTTRGMIVTILYRLEGSPAVSSASFDDVAAGEYYANGVYWAAANGVVSGYGNDQFGPNDPITREQMATILYRYAQYKEYETTIIGDVSSFTDGASVSSYAVEPMNWAVGIGLISGVGNNMLNPSGNATRAQVAAILMRFCDPDRTASDETYTVTFDYNYGSKGTYQTVTVEAGDAVDKPVNPTRSGYAFAGWYTKAVGGEKFDFDKAVTEDMTLYAHWNENSSGGGSSNPDPDPETYYTVTFNSNGGSAVTSQVIKEGLTASVPENPVRDGFEFVGWYVDAELTETYNFEKSVTENITLYAGWSEDVAKKDVDSDGVFDYIEEYFDTSSESDDTDGDGLTDYIEIFVLHSDPTSTDTDGNGVLDGNEDADEDGLTNLQEIEARTDPVKADTDADGLTDYDEINKHRTNPLSYDTDLDGVSDGYEIELDTDPLTANDSFQITKSEQSAEDEMTVSVSMELSGEQVDTLRIEDVDNDLFFPEDMPGYIGKAYDFSVDGAFGSATISFKFDSALLRENADPAIFYFNEETQTLKELETTIIDNVASATVAHFSTYILLDRTVYYGSFTWEDVWETSDTYSSVEIVLVVDDSGSMTSNDRNHQRLTVAQNLIDKLPEGSKIGVVKFASSTTLLTKALTSDKETAKAFLTTAYFKSSGGTYMYTAINKSFGLFNSADEDILRMMVVLSDGQSSGRSSHSSTIAAANEKNVRLYTVGLGSSTSYFTNYLKPLAEETGGSFYLASQADELGEIYENINKQIDLDTDTDGDTIPDYYEDHMVAFNGVKIQLDKTKADSDQDGLADNEEVKVELVYDASGKKVYVKSLLLSDPTLLDSDYDGKVDSKDAVPTSNWFTGKLSTDYATSSISTFMDYRWFFKDNTVYNSNLSKLSLLFSSAIYSGSSVSLKDSQNKQTTNGNSIEQVMEYFGMEHPKTYSLRNYYSDNHLSEVGLGYHNVVFNGQRQTVLAVTIRGTNGTIEEWASNFDVGDIRSKTENDGWKNTSNHKGFDVTANRIMELIQQYIEDYKIDEDILVYWVTGHSRGAAIANIIGANLEDTGCTAFTYTFAAPNTTLASNASSYRSIFNIVNADDFVPCLPMATWGYTRYGRTASSSIASNYEKAWEKLTGIWDYNPDTFGMQDTVSELGKILSGDARVECYKYTCDDHGDGSNDTITIRNNGISKDSREEAIGKIPSNALPYCKITRHDGGWFGGWDFEVCQLPAYFMQILAAKMAGKIGNYRFVVELNIADRYESAKSAIIGSAIGGLEHPHYTESYYVLADHISASQF